MEKGNKKEIYRFSITPEETEKVNRKCSTFALLSVAAFIPFFILFIVPGFGLLSVALEVYEANIAYVIFCFVYFLCIVWNALMSFFAYRIREEVPAKNAPIGGFAKIPYFGIFLALLIGGLFVLYDIILFFIYTFTQSSFDFVGLIALAFLVLSVLLSANYYVVNFKTNKNAELVTINTNNEKANKITKENQTKLFHSLYGLSEEEKELGKQEFEDEE